MEYKKPQATIIQGNVGIYPLTTADQVILADGTRLEKDGKINVDVANSAKLGGKAPEYYIQPRNLLDNSDFRNPVNQRGFVNGNAVELYNYFIDRWISGESSINPSLNNNGIMPNGAFFQRLDNLSTYIGRNMTFAIGLSSGDIVIASGTLTDVSDNDITIFNTTDGQNEISVGSDGGLWYVWINYPSSTIQWAALYEGSYTAETLPPYVPKGYAAELAECQRYYQIIRLYRHLSTIYDNQYRYYGCSLPVKMRTTPTVTIESMDEFKVNSFDKNSLTSYSGESYSDFEGMAISFMCKSEFGTVQSQCYVSTKIACSADL